ncbi:2140_t:CDS:2 [Gigaspora rosea]|nr:2140_t:CDS:2 [Gigaspora rosea]
MSWTILYSIPLLIPYIDKKVYGQYNQEQLSVFTITFHYLLHVAYSICQYGPSWTYWQYPIECLIGILQPTINSHLHPYTNLYFVHEYNDASVILAYIEWANISNENNHQFGLKKFWYFGHKDFIDVKAIKRCVGFFKFDNDIIY